MRRREAIQRIVIIGGGISGLSSAFYVRQEAKRRGMELQVTIVDGAPKLGGKIHTLERDGFVIEKGPDSFLSRKLPIIDLAKELGLEGELTATNPAAKKTYIMHRRKLHPMPPGMMLGIPTEIGPFVKSGLISWRGKLRALMDLFIPPSKSTEDETLGGFMERRVGKEVMRRIAEPLLAGIYAGDLKKLSLRATFPQFLESERKHGSLIKGMLHNRKAAAAAAAKTGGSTFLTFRSGLSTLVRALDEALPDVERRLGVKVTAIHRLEDGEYEVELADGERLEADRIIVTAPAFAAAELLKPLADCEELRAIRYVSVANVVLAYDKKQFGLAFDGTGFVVPRSEGLHITACTWTSTKWLHTSPSDKVLLRCYVGHSEDQESVKLPDKELIAAVRADIRSVLGVTAEPLFTEITRLNRSMPQYPLGHVERMRELRGRLREQLPGVWVTGAAFDGVGLPDCIRQGKEAAAIVIDELS